MSEDTESHADYIFKRDKPPGKKRSKNSLQTRMMPDVSRMDKSDANTGISAASTTLSTESPIEIVTDSIMEPANNLEMDLITHDQSTSTPEEQNSNSNVMVEEIDGKLNIQIFHDEKPKITHNGTELYLSETPFEENIVSTNVAIASICVAIVSVLISYIIFRKHKN
jgi:hypothetical protein